MGRNYNTHRLEQILPLGELRVSAAAYLVLVISGWVSLIGCCVSCSVQRAGSIITLSLYSSHFLSHPDDFNSFFFVNRLINRCLKSNTDSRTPFALATIPCRPLC